MIKMPLVSVVIPCYNHGRYIQDCIKSVINQNYENIELIIIDDGSSDNSVEKIIEMIPACKRRFVRFNFINRENRGLSTTLNEAVNWSKGVYFSAIASDDVMFSHKTSTLLSHLEEQKDLAGVFSGFCLLDEESKVTRSVNLIEKYYSFEDVVLLNYHINSATQLLRRDCLLKVGCYPDSIYIEDWCMWLALLNKGYKLKVVDQLLAGYRQHGESMSKNVLKMHEGRLKVLEYYAAHPLQKKSVAKCYLFASIDYSSISKLEMTNLIFKGICNYPKIVFSNLFFKCIVRLVAPRYIILFTKNIFYFTNHYWSNCLLNILGRR